MASPVELQGGHDPKPVKLTLYRWAGKWGPFKVNIPCGECTLTADIVADVLDNELSNAVVEVVVKDWLTHLPEALFRGAHHAPAILLNGKVISQGKAVNRGLLAEAVMAAHVRQFPIEGTHIFGKDACRYCDKAKAALEAAGIAFTYHDVVRNPGALYEMVSRTKEIIGPRTPVTTPQVWIDGAYLGGYDQLVAHLAGQATETALAA